MKSGHSACALAAAALIMGPIYLRLGELYEEEDDVQSARMVYEEIAELFPAGMT